MASTFGTIFRLTTFGESHGPAIGAIVEGVPPGLQLEAEEIQYDLDRRRPGARGDDPRRGLVSPRAEKDEVEILSGVFEGKTLGTAIGLLIRNHDVDSSKYERVRGKFRGSHADWAWLLKNGFFDWRGGGRSSARETAARVAAGAIARKILALRGVDIRAYVIQIGRVKARRRDLDQVEVNSSRYGIWCPDAKAAEAMAGEVRTAMEAGDSVGAVIEVIAHGVPPGLGEPCFDKLDAVLAQAFMSLPAVKGVEIGGGFALGTARGSNAIDELFLSKGRIESRPNYAGGILGGISTGNEIVVRFAVKPTSSVRIPKKTVKLDWDAYERGEDLSFTDREDGERATIVTEGRHDPCVGIRAVPIAEAMMALVLCDYLLLQDISESWKQRMTARRRAAQKRDNILLIGARSAGKTTVGRALAERLGREFVEMDAALTDELRGQGIDGIAQLVEQSGWKAFRRMERNLMRALAGQHGMVVACGGGIAGDAETAALARKAGLVVWLDTPTACLIERRTQDPAEAGRPALIAELTELKRDDPAAYLQIEVPAVLAQRRSYYGQADVRIGGVGTAAEVVEQIVSKLREWGMSL